MTTIHVRYEVLDDPSAAHPESPEDAYPWGVRAVGLPGKLSAYGVGDTRDEAPVDLSEGISAALFRWLGAGFLGRVERGVGPGRADRAELLLVQGEVLADGPDDVEHRGRRYPHPGDQALRRADHHLAVRCPCFGRRLAAHE